MRVALLAGFLFSMFLPTAGASTAPPCVAAPGRVAVALAGTVAGLSEFRAAVGPGWTFALLPVSHGWDLRLFDGDGLDLSQITPPYRFAPNPRELYGWHFRNSDNTGVNDGSVNAPQHARLFRFDPALSGTAGFKPSADIAAVEGAPGRGLLTVEGFELTDLDKGGQARFTSLAFSVCLSWPNDLGAEPAFVPEVIEQIRGCGLDSAYELSPFLRPSTVSGDFDGDDSHDLAVPVVRASSGKRGLAVCRAGTYLDLVGFEGRMGEVVPAYFDRIDHWSLHPKGPVGESAAQGPPPELVGDAILIGKEDSSSALLYWNGKRWHAYWQGD